MTSSVGGRPSKHDLRRQRMEFIGLLAEGHDPVEAAQISGHRAERALETLRDLGFTLSVLDGDMDVAA
jgi:hypothetical protein